jgi:hypothetical protein
LTALRPRGIAFFDEPVLHAGDRRGGFALGGIIL